MHVVVYTFHVFVVIQLVSSYSNRDCLLSGSHSAVFISQSTDGMNVEQPTDAIGSTVSKDYKVHNNKSTS